MRLEPNDRIGAFDSLGEPSRLSRGRPLRRGSGPGWVVRLHVRLSVYWSCAEHLLHLGEPSGLEVGLALALELAELPLHLEQLGESACLDG